jgi:hypothetical protein
MGSADYYTHQILHNATRRELEHQAAQARLANEMTTFQARPKRITFVNLLNRLPLPGFALELLASKSCTPCTGSLSSQCCAAVA